MKRKTLIVMLALITAFALLVFQACTGGDGGNNSGGGGGSGSGDNPPSHTHNFGTAWQKDGTGHWHECSCGEKSSFAAHQFNGNICTVCQYDKSGPTPPHTHNFGIAWQKDGTGHWHECSCGEKSGFAAHQFNGRVCTVCQYDKIEELPPHEHNFVAKYRHNSAEHWQACWCGATQNEGVHAFADNGYCSVCSQPKVHTHDFAATWQTTDTTHWQACSGCDAQKNFGKHVYNAQGECTVCHEKHTHSYDQYGFDENTHWKECVCGAKESSTQSHQMSDEKCSVCGATSKGLEYSSMNGGCVVSGYSGELYAKLIVPSKHNGETVIGIKNSAGSFNQGVFYQKSISKIWLPDSITTIGDGTFNNVFDLDEIVLPDGVTEIAERTFYRSSLKYVKLGSRTTRIGSQAFTESNIEYIALPDSLNELASSAFSLCSKLKIVNFGSGLKTIGDYAFSQCKQLVQALMNDGITSIGQSAFLECKNLDEVSVLGNMTIGSGAFNSCSALSHVTLSGLKSIGNMMFLECNALAQIEIPSSVTEIGASAFRNCYNLARLTLNEGLLTIGENAFQSCYDLEEVEIPDTVTSIGKKAFDRCLNLTSFKFGANVDTVPESCFSGDYELEQVDLANVRTISKNAFAGVTDLFEIELPTTLETIGLRAFDECTALSRLIMPSSVKTIDQNAFADCSALTKVYYNGDSSQWDDISGKEWLDSVQKYYFKADPPQETGNYWYYDDKGNAIEWSVVE